MRRIVLLVVMLSCSLAMAQGVPSAPGISKRSAAKKVIVKPTVAAENLSWTQPSSGCSVSCTYNVYKGATSGSETLYQSGIAGLTYQDLAVTRGNIYYYEVTAVNSVGEGPKSNEAFAQVSNNPTAPVLLVTSQ